MGEKLVQSKTIEPPLAPSSVVRIELFESGQLNQRADGRWSFVFVERATGKSSDELFFPNQLAAMAFVALTLLPSSTRAQVTRIFGIEGN